MGKVISINSRRPAPPEDTPEWRPVSLSFADGARGLFDYLVLGADLYPEEAEAILLGVDSVVEKLEEVGILAAMEAIDAGVVEEAEHPLNQIADKCQYLVDFLTTGVASGE